MTKEGVLAFIKKHDLAVVATASKDGMPTAAVVEFGELDDLTIIIDTLKSSRKYQNLQANPQVAIVIGWDDDVTVQISATAHELQGSELEQAKASYFAKNERAKKWENWEGIAYFAFKPVWLKYSDVGKDPWVVKDLTFDS